MQENNHKSVIKDGNFHHIAENQMNADDHIQGVQGAKVRLAVKSILSFGKSTTYS
jgi:hypothetical protein